MALTLWCFVARMDEWCTYPRTMLSLCAGKTRTIIRRKTVNARPPWRAYCGAERMWTQSVLCGNVEQRRFIGISQAEQNPIHMQHIVLAHSNRAANMDVWSEVSYCHFLCVFCYICNFFGRSVGLFQSEILRANRCERSVAILSRHRIEVEKHKPARRAPASIQNSSFQFEVNFPISFILYFQIAYVSTLMDSNLTSTRRVLSICVFQDTSAKPQSKCVHCWFFWFRCFAVYSSEHNLFTAKRKITYFHNNNLFECCRVWVRAPNSAIDHTCVSPNATEKGQWSKNEKNINTVIEKKVENQFRAAKNVSISVWTTSNRLNEIY